MREPPRAATVALLAALALLLFYPLHRPYQHPDQDLVPTLPLYFMASPTWRPRIVNAYGSALPNLLHVVDAVTLRIGRVAGWWTDPSDLLVAWCRAPATFRIAPRAVAMIAGLASLIAARGIVGIVAPGWSALVAPAILGTWLMFVREHHHGLYDAPASGLALLALWMATAHARAPSLRHIVAAAALAGLATACKYNLAPAVVAVVASAVVVPPAWRTRTALVAIVTAAVAFVVGDPEVVVDHARWYAYVSAYIPLQKQVLATAAGTVGNHLMENASHGIGWVGLALAAAGLPVALTARNRALVPLIVFPALYALVLWTTPLALDRYILPIAGPLAVLAALALSRLPPALGVALAAFVVGIGLPSCVQYVRLLAIEDTRVEAAKLVRAEWARGGRVLIAANPVLSSYVGPDLAALPRYDPPLPATVLHAIETHAPHCTRPLESLTFPDGADASDALRPYAGALVITVDAPAPDFVRASTPPAVAAALAQHAALVGDLQVERYPAHRHYEVFDLDYVPFTGIRSLLRPGPRMRFWRVAPP